MAQVTSGHGVPLASFFSSATGTPLYIDLDTGNFYYLNDSGVMQQRNAAISGSGSPEGVVTAAKGSFFTRTDGGANTTLYVKESGSGNTGWVAK